MKKTLSIIFMVFIAMITSSCNKTIYENSNIIYAMDTAIYVTIYSNDVNSANSELREINNIYQKYNKLSDAYNEYTDTINIYSLNKLRSAEVSDELLELINEAVMMKTETNGYFEPLIGSLSNLWKECLFTEDITPYVLESDIVNQELDKITSSEIVIDGNIVSINGDADIDLGAIAKGFATNKVYEYLKEKNVINYLLNAGSSNVLLGEKIGGKSFTVGLTKALDNGYYQTISMKNCALVTSAIKEQHVVINNVIYHHIINPKTGYPSNYYDSLTIVGEDSGILDAYSTAMFSMDNETLTLFAASKVDNLYAYSGEDLVVTYAKS